MTHDLQNAPRADVMTVNTDDHNKWALHALSFQYEMLPTHLRSYHPNRPPDGDLGPGYYDEYIPQTYDIKGGNVLKKNVEHKTTECPECGAEARKGERSIPTCVECGVLCTSDKKPDHEVVFDPKATGRVDSDGNFI